MRDTNLEAPAGEPVPGHDASIGRWIVQAARSAAFQRPDWTGLRGTPLLLAAACLANLAVAIGFTRAIVQGPVAFQWTLLHDGWLYFVLVAWGCWLGTSAPARSGAPAPVVVDAPTLLTMVWLQGLVLEVLWCVVSLPLIKGVGGLGFPDALAWLPTIGQVGWAVCAQIDLALDSTRAAGGWRRAGMVASLLLAVAMSLSTPQSFWRPVPAPRPVVRAPEAASPAASDPQDADEADADAGPNPPILDISQETFERQQQLLARQLAAIAPQRPGVVDLYAITFAPYADVDVFMRESGVVAGVMEQRFDTRGRTLQLVNNAQTTDTLPWASTLNLQRAIERMAQRMDRDEDILFIHLTSHGGADGHLAAEFFPLTMAELTPQQLRRWLDDAHVRNRVISISACFSGSWIAPLANDDTLVMTAADADHTSYGCGSKSTLTFFGQAMYDEQLRHTWSFEDAHAAARQLIDQREKAAGKSDGYSNPQIRMGSRIRERLKALEARLAASGAAH